MKTPQTKKIELKIPDDWTPEQLLAVFDLIDDLRDKIWGRYGPALQHLIQAQKTPITPDQPGCQQTELPF